MSISNHRIITILLPALSLVVLSSACDDGPVRTEQLEFDEAVSRIEVDSGAGDIVIVGDAEREGISVEAVIRGEATRLRWSIDEGNLHLDHSCAPLGSCAVDWYVWVPQAGLDGLDLESGAGDIRVDDLLANVRASTGAGEVSLRDVIAGAIELETGSGDLTLGRCEADDVELDSGAGSIDVMLTTSPRRVAIDTGSGDVDLSVPAQGYRLDIDTGSGDVEIHGLTHDPGADSLIAISTGAGDVSISGR